MNDKTHREVHPDPVMPACETQRWLTGQKALVTGASSGIGREIALALGQFGADVVVNYASSPDGAEATVADIRREGGNAFAFRADVSDETQVEAMYARMLAEFGTIDILVNNAGLQQDAKFDEMTLAST
jgi:glucose 1-dehydrogenase